MTNGRKTAAQRFYLCNNAHLYELLGSELFIHLVCYCPSVHIYERADYNSGMYEWGYSDREHKVMTRESLIATCNLGQLKEWIKEGVLNG